MQSAVDSNTSASVVTLQDIENSASNNIAEALRYQSGMFYMPPGGTSGAQRGEPAIYIRGMGSGRIGMFLDGIPVSALYGRTDWGQFSTYGISEISISKGYASPVYGMNTLGGAINMVTSKPMDKLEVGLKYGFISNNEHQATLSLGSNLGEWYLQASYSFINRDSYNLSSKFKPTNLAIEDGGEKFNSYYTNHTLRAKVGWNPNKNHEYSLNLIYQAGDKGGITNTRQSSPYWKWPHYDKITFYLLGHSKVLDALNIDTRFYYDSFYNELNALGMQNNGNAGYRGTSIYDDYRIGGILDFGYEFNEDIKLNIGANLMGQRHRSMATKGSDPDKDLEDLSSSIYLQYAQEFNKYLRLVTSASYDRNDMTKAILNTSGGKGDKTNMQGWTLQGILYYNATDYLTLHFNAGKKNYLPDLSSRYSERMGSTIPNPNLQPESAINYELGLNLDIDSTNFSASVFYNDYIDMITDITVPPNGRYGTCSSPQTGSNGGNQYCYYYLNINEGYSYGVELALTQGFWEDRIQLGANYTYTQKVTSAESNNGVRIGKILNYPNHIANLNFLITPIPQLDFILNMTYQSAMWTTQTTKNKSVFLADLKLNYRIIDGLQASLGAYNVLDANYYYQVGYYMPGRRIFLNLEYKY